MLEFLYENRGTVLILIILLAVVGAVLAKMASDRKKGNSCCGNCASCSANCHHKDG